MQKGKKTEAAPAFEIKGKRIAIVVAEWNAEVTTKLYDGAKKRLLELGIEEADIMRFPVPGSFELTTGARWAAERPDVDAIICLGVVIQGETRHFDFICDAVANGLTQLAMMSKKSVIFGVLTTNTLEQAHERAGGKVGHKGVEAADTVVKMLVLQEQIYDIGKKSIGFMRG